MVAASKIEKKVKNTKFSLEGTSVSDPYWIRIKIGSGDLDWDSGSRYRFRVTKCTPKLFEETCLEEPDVLFEGMEASS